jgi:predicted kinase
MHAILICGAPGAGKSAALTALTDALTDADVRHAAFEVDELTRAHPPVLASRLFSHAGLMAEAYRDAGHDLLLVAATIESQWSLQALSDAIGATTRFVVRLEADPDTLRRRITEREPAGWSGLRSLVAAAEPLAKTHAKLEQIDLTVSTETADPGAIAAEIRRATGR